MSLSLDNPLEPPAPTIGQMVQPSKCPLLERPVSSDVHVDSGYATASNSPPSDQKTTGRPHRSIPQSLNPFRSRETPELKHFDYLDIDEAVHQRFTQIQASLNPSLLAYLGKSGKRRKSGKRLELLVSIRNMVLGKDENVAKPWIVVFCHADDLRIIRHFFGKADIQALCRPQDPALYDFDVHFLGIAPKVHASVDIAANDWGMLTACGSRLRYTGAGRSATYATLGGIVKFVAGDGSYHLVGMTVGHLKDPPHEELFWNDGDSEDDELSQSEYSSDEEEQPSTPTKLPAQHRALDGQVFASIEQRLPLNSDECLQASGSEATTAGVVMPLSPAQEIVPEAKASHVARTQNWREIPDSALTISEGSSTRDWAVFSINANNKDLMLPNRLPRREDLPGSPPYLLACDQGQLKLFRRPVFLATPSGIKSGSMSTRGCQVLLNTKGFVDVYTVNMDKGLEDGDSGSWVIDQQSSQVYGHLVASDALGAAYIVPLHDTFAEMTSQLSLKHVELPSDIDIFGKMEDMPSSTSPPAGTTENQCVAELAATSSSESCDFQNAYDFQSVVNPVFGSTVPDGDDEIMLESDTFFDSEMFLAPSTPPPSEPHRTPSTPPSMNLDSGYVTANASPDLVLKFLEEQAKIERRRWLSEDDHGDSEEVEIPDISSSGTSTKQADP